MVAAVQTHAPLQVGHALGALRTASRTDWADVVLARINYAGLSMDAKPSLVKPVLARTHASGKAVCGMKVMGCGELASDARGAIQYAFQLGSLHAITIGITTREQLLENLSLVEELAPQSL